MRVQVLHVIESLHLGGGLRAAVAASKYSARFGSFDHAVIGLTPGYESQELLRLAGEAGMAVLPTHALGQAVAQADIVQLNWWNHPVVDQFLRSKLPPMRLVAWMHVGGHQAPQIITESCLEFFDEAVACSPYTSESPALQGRRSWMAYGATDFARLEGFAPRPHNRFVIGYVGSVDFTKMHSDYVAMSVAAQIPEALFLVCGGGGDVERLREQALRSAKPSAFEIAGFVADVRVPLSVFDVYGYPLCPDTYAASELNLQEVMYCGIPPVVFPYGGVKRLIQDQKTGLIVSSAEEYSKALEWLYHHPLERKRIGEAAAQYARSVFGADKAALELNRVYESAMSRPKRERAWSGRFGASQIGHERFIEGLGSQSMDFEQSLSGSDDQALEAEERIKRVSSLLRSSIRSYAKHYSKDGVLAFWAGLVAWGDGDHATAVNCLTGARALGVTHWKVAWHTARISHEMGNLDGTLRAAEEVLALRPGFPAAREMVQSLRGADPSRVGTDLSAVASAKAERSVLIYYNGLQNTDVSRGGSSFACYDLADALALLESVRVVHLCGDSTKRENLAPKVSVISAAESDRSFESYDEVIFISAFKRYVRTPKRPGQRWVLFAHCWDIEQEDLGRRGDTDLFAAVSEVHREYLVGKYVGAAQSVALPNTVDTTLFCPRPVPRNPHSLLFCGAIVPHKGVHLLAEAFLSLRARIPDLELHVYGSAAQWGDSGDYERKLKQILQGAAVFHEPVSRFELAEVYSTHALLCLPSMLESFSLVSIEAQSCGCLPVLHNVGGTRATVRDGETGFLYAPNTAEQLALAIERALRAVSEQPGLRARARQFVSDAFGVRLFRERVASFMAQL